MLGNFVTGLGTQAALVALPYQVFVKTGSTFLVGLLGLSSSSRSCWPARPARSPTGWTAAGCSCSTRSRSSSAPGWPRALAGHPPLVLLYALGGLLAGSRDPERRALGDHPQPRPAWAAARALAFNFGLYSSRWSSARGWAGC